MKSEQPPERQKGMRNKAKTRTQKSEIQKIMIEEGKIRLYLSPPELKILELLILDVPKGCFQLD